MDMKTAQLRRGPLGGAYGVYQIRAATAAETPIPIPRVRGVDPQGILYVGRSGFWSRSRSRTIANRIHEFLVKRHSGGITYARAGLRLKRTEPFTGHLLQVRAAFLEDRQIVLKEASVLDQYFAKYAELPPCNSQSGGGTTRKR
jgi:hypothetical protein